MLTKQDYHPETIAPESIVSIQDMGLACPDGLSIQEKDCWSKYHVYRDKTYSLIGSESFIVHGMLEDVIPPTMLFRLVEALQKENKSFDMLLLPNLGHGLNAYTIKRSWDYVVEHLLELEPPENFKLESAFG